MRRNVDLIRSLLFAVEANDDPFQLVDPKIDGFSELEVSHHIALMAQGGLITARDRSAIGIYNWSAGQLTYAGHELLDCARDDALWAEAKDSVQRVSGGVALELVKSTLVQRIRSRLDASGRAKRSE